MLDEKINNNLTKIEDNLEEYFAVYRKQTIGYDQYFNSPYGRKKLNYADWTASGRLYRPIEDKLINDFGPYVANTHTESNITGTTMTKAYKSAKEIIKKHVNADEKDVIIFAGYGATSAINKLQRLLNIRVSEKFKQNIKLEEAERPIIFITHLEHHSNHTSWLETIGDVIILKPTNKGLIDLEHLDSLLEKYKHRKLKIGSFTACSNVTGVKTPYHKLARKMHEYGGYCFVDFAASAPYVNIDMHPDNSPLEKLDGIFLSPHKFLGGPGTSGVLIFDGRLYDNEIPDNPGGGTVSWTNPWTKHGYLTDIETREDGGTPGFLQAIKAALTIQLKDQMGIDNLLRREEELKELLIDKLEQIPEVKILDNINEERLAIISIIIDGLHYNLVTKLLNDRFGIQVRGGCACAGTYGHYLFDIDENTSNKIVSKVIKGDLSNKPGWIRISLHPIMTNDEVLQIVSAIEQIIENYPNWQEDYSYDPSKNDFFHKEFNEIDINQLFLK